MNFGYKFLVPADAHSWPERMEAACHAFESCQKIALQKAHTGTKNNATTAEIDNRARFFRDKLKTKTRWFSLYSGKGLTHVGNSFVNESYYNIGGAMYGSGSAYAVSVLLPDQSHEQHEKLLVSIGDALEAHSSEYTPGPVAERLHAVQFRSPLGCSASAFGILSDLTAEEASLPWIRQSLYEGLQECQPHSFGWVNYWSQQVCTYVNFPEMAKGLPMLGLSYQTPRGAWLVKLTEAPFEARNAVHIRALHSAYEAFPKVGIRVSKAQQGVQGPTSPPSAGPRP